MRHQRETGPHLVDEAALVVGAREDGRDGLGGAGEPVGRHHHDVLDATRLELSEHADVALPHFDTGGEPGSGASGRARG
jgi:hypothetical protein